MKILKRVFIAIASLAGVVVLAAVVMYFLTKSRMNSTYDVLPRSILIPTDSATLSAGKHWVDVYCTQCHGEQLQGTRMFEDPSIGYIDAPNLTRGKGGISAAYTDVDWIRSVKHGVRPSGKPLLVMPASDYHSLTDTDLGAILAYVQSVPAVDHKTHGYDLSFFSHILAGLGAFGDFLPVENIDHAAPPVEATPGVTPAYGAYLVSTGGCRTCHGKELAGGQDPNPNAPPSPNLTPGGPLQTWSPDDFLTTMRTGFTPDRRPIQAAFMPWPNFARFSDNELRALFAYLHSLPALPTAD